MVRVNAAIAQIVFSWRENLLRRFFAALLIVFVFPIENYRL